ncbi:MAG: hypothetical protein PF961_22975 [Planctomycetota bacterium]|jgi:hypothetical protein|nr:hypothetical protein [Planctomycetota bacterium]
MSSRVFSYQCMPDKDIVVVFGEGTIRVRGLFEILIRISQDESCRKTHKRLLDLRRAELKLSPDDAHRFADLVKKEVPQLGENRYAVLLAPMADRHTAGLIRRELEPLGVEIQLFNDHVEALQWLYHDSDLFPGGTPPDPTVADPAAEPPPAPGPDGSEQA